MITYALTGWTGGAVDADGVDWFADSTGWFGPTSVRSNEEDRPAGDGTYSSRSYKNARVISIFGHAKAPTPELASKARDQFNALLGDGKLDRLVVAEPVETRTALVRIAGTPDLTPIKSTSFDYQLIVTAPDPRKYSNTLYSASTQLASPAPGGVNWANLQWNGSAGTTGVTWQSAGGTTGVMTLTNEWKADAPITFDITGPVVNPRITNLATQQVLQWGGTVDTGQVLTIDTGSHSVRLGAPGMSSQNRKAQMIRTDYFEIGPQQTITVLFQADTFTASSATAQWRWAAM